MKKTTLNAIIDTIAFFPLLVTAVTGIIIWLYLPRGLALGALGTIASHQTFLGIQRQVWLDVHTYLGLLFTALVAVHLVLHWYYIKRLPQRFAGTATKKDHSMRRFLALLLIGVVMVAAVIIAVYASNPSPSSPTTSSGSITNTTTKSATAAVQSQSATKSVTTSSVPLLTVSPAGSSVPSPTATATPSSIPTSINGIPTSVNGLDYIYYHNLNDRSTCVLCHPNM